MQAACYKFFQVSTFVESGHHRRLYEGVPACPQARVSAHLPVPAHIGSERTTAAIVFCVRSNSLRSAVVIDWLLLIPPRDSSFPSTYSIKLSGCYAQHSPPCYKCEVSLIVYQNIESLIPPAFQLHISMEIGILYDVLHHGKAQRRFLIRSERRQAHRLGLCSRCLFPSQTTRQQPWLTPQAD